MEAPVSLSFADLSSLAFAPLVPRRARRDDSGSSVRSNSCVQTARDDARRRLESNSDRCDRNPDLLSLRRE